MAIPFKIDHICMRAKFLPRNYCTINIVSISSMVRACICIIPPPWVRICICMHVNVHIHSASSFLAANYDSLSQHVVKVYILLFSHCEALIWRGRPRQPCARVMASFSISKSRFKSKLYENLREDELKAWAFMYFAESSASDFAGSFEVDCHQMRVIFNHFQPSFVIYNKCSPSFKPWQENRGHLTLIVLS